MRHTLHVPVLSALALACLCAPALAQYKVIAPDGRVTYTDRPPSDGSMKVQTLGRREPPADTAAAAPALPLELQRLSGRFPVTLFTSSDCAPCDAGRDFLRQRGVPYAERQIVSDEDIQALERTVGVRSLPALTVGGQALRGFSAGDWGSYLDAAGYPRESRLPAGWQPPAPAPLVARAPVPAPAAPAPRAPAAPSGAESPSAVGNPGTTIRF